MAYDEELADRIRELLAGETALSQQPMFGGLAFLLNGNMAIAASRQGGVLVRVDPAEAERAVAAGEAEVAVMGGRRMRGWLRVGADHLRTDPALAAWVTRARDHAHTLPPKHTSARTRSPTHR